MNPYGWLVKIRDFLHRHRFIRTFKAPIPVISIGNLNTGGSGKTPFIHFLVQEIQSRYPTKKIVVISKSYKAALKEPQEVTTLDIQRPEIFGDEPCLLKSLLQIDVWAGPTKYKTLQKALSNKQYDIALIDDGFSHLKLEKDLDIVLFDVSREPKHYRLLPRGFMREPWTALARSSLVVLTKTENQDFEKVNQFIGEIKKYQSTILTAEFETSLDIPSKNIFLFSGLGNPEAVVRSLEKLDFKILRTKSYADHYEFPLVEQENIWQDFSKLKALIPDVELVATTKDLIKIKNLHLLKVINPIKLDLSMPEEQRRIIHEKISRLF